jgi:hypothetical protein
MSDVDRYVSIRAIREAAQERQIEILSALGVDWDVTSHSGIFHHRDAAEAIPRRMAP